MSDTNGAVLREFQRAVWSSPQPIPRARGRGSASNSLQNSPVVQFSMEITEEDSRQDVVSEGGVSVRSSYSSPSQSTSQTEDLPNFNIDLYRDLVPPFGQGRLIGQGAFAGVYLHKYQEKSCAVKFFDMQYQMPLEDQLEDMFTRELYRNCLIHHPNIVKLLGANSSPGNRCIITEYGGRCLYDYIHTKKERMSYRSILKITKGVAQALDHLHTNDIVHRDLHPGNVVITEGGRVKVLDVGIAKILEHTSSQDSQRNNYGVPLGSFRYLAPEIFLGERINCKVDIFALGMIMLEMWTTQRPWEKLSDAAICHNITRGERPELPRDMPTAFQELISDCWQKVCKERPVAAEIARVCDEELGKNPSINQS